MMKYYEALTQRLSQADWVLTTSARAVFAGVLAVYFWAAGLTKLSDGPLGFLTLSDSAYIQIFPKAVETAGYDASQLGLLHWGIALAGTWAEFLLPFMIVLGALTRLAALGMISFVAVQSVVDILGHGVDADTIGRWFDATSDAAILDQRAFWVFLLMVLVIKGAGPISLDAVLRRKTR